MRAATSISASLAIFLLAITSLHSNSLATTIPLSALQVQCDAGQIVGAQETVTLHDESQYQLAVFRGIPYAEAPTGDRRFAKPVPKARFSEPFSAQSNGPACPQSNPKDNVMSEDCLNLNIYVPASALPGAGGASGEPLAVLFWIHGGKYVEGEGRRSPVWNLAAYGNIIVVTINYRLGALGFLSTDDEEAAGNFGLWDQRLALKWVKGNIEAFGGDPKKITLHGGSSGAASVTYQAMYSPNDKLFQRIIVGSGNALSVPTYHEQASLYAEALAKEFDCGTGSSSEIIECLRQVSFEEIVQAQDVEWQSPYDFPWTPVVDGEFIQEAPLQTATWPASSSNLDLLRSVDAMFGTTSADGSLSISLWLDERAKAQGMSIKKGVSEFLFNQTIEDLLTMYGEPLQDDVKDAVYEEYFAWEDPENIEAIGQSTVELTTDKHFFVPQVIFTRNHALNNNEANAYLFQFEEPRPDDKGRAWIKGTKHGHYVFFALAMPEERLGRPVDLTDPRDAKAWELSKKFMTYFSNFVKTGDPNSPRPVPEEWEPFTIANEEYLHLDGDVIESRDHCKAERTRFWLETVPAMG